MYTFYPTRPFRHPVQVTILREETLHRMSCHKESEVFFSVYSHIYMDFKITVPQKRNSTQSTSKVKNKLFRDNWNHWPSAMDWTAVQWRCKLIINNWTNRLPVFSQTVYVHVHTQRKIEKIWCFWLVPLWNGVVPLNSILLIIEYVNSNTHALLDCITVQLQETTHH